MSPLGHRSGGLSVVIGPTLAGSVIVCACTSSAWSQPILHPSQVLPLFPCPLAGNFEQSAKKSRRRKSRIERYPLQLQLLEVDKSLFPITLHR
jgi:hypothetical protein